MNTDWRAVADAYRNLIVGYSDEELDSVIRLHSDPIWAPNVTEGTMLRAQHDRVCLCPFDGSDNTCNLALTGTELGALLTAFASSNFDS